MGKAYFINNIEFTDMQKFMEYANAMKPILEDEYSAVLIAEPTKPNVFVVEGEFCPKHTIIYEFPSMELAMQYVNDPRTQELWKTRRAGSKSNIYIVEDLAGEK
jgi:uncharacterized protein (DUF1330 family)